MSNIIQELYDRKSVRVFEDRPVPEDVKNQIIDAAMQAPTAGCQCLYTILDIQDPELKAQLADSCDHQPFIAKAPLVLIFLADARRWRDAYVEAGAAPREIGVGDMLLAYCDATIAAQNSVVAAHALGLGSCYIGDILEQKELHTQMLGLEHGVMPAVMLVYGYPTLQQRQRPKPARFGREYLVQTDRYAPQSGGELREMMASREKAGYDFDKEMAAFCKRKYNSDFAAEMTRSVGAWLADYAPFTET